MEDAVAHTQKRLSLQCREFIFFNFARWAHDLWWTSIDSADKIYLDWFAFISSNHETSIQCAHHSDENNPEIKFVDNKFMVCKINFSSRVSLKVSQKSKQ